MLVVLGQLHQRVEAPRLAIRCLAPQAGSYLPLLSSLVDERQLSKRRGMERRRQPVRNGPLQKRRCALCFAMAQEEPSDPEEFGGGAIPIGQRILHEGAHSGRERGQREDIQSVVLEYSLQWARGAEP